MLFSIGLFSRAIIFKQNKTKPKREPRKKEETLSHLVLSQPLQSPQGAEEQTRLCSECSRS